MVLGAGPVGILGAMKLVAEGFQTFVYSRSPAPNIKSELIESIGAKYVSAINVPPAEFARMTGNIDLIYEAVGVSRISFDLLVHLGQNGIFVFTGIPAPHPEIDVDADIIMRNLVLKNQVVVGTVNADGNAFQEAIQDLGIFLKRWPAAIKSVISDYSTLEDYRELLLGKKNGIKNVVRIG